MIRLHMYLACGLALSSGAMAQPAPAPPAAQEAPAAPASAVLTYQQPLAGEAIQVVQDRLRSQGGYAGAVNGVWGADSQQALTQYQQTHGLQPTGQLNQATALLLGLTPAQLLTAGATPPLPAPAGAPVGVPIAAPNTAPVAAPVAPPARPPQEGAVLSIVAVRNLQSRLRDLGYYTGGVDGQWGPKAQDALRRFQQANGIEVSGRINPQTVTAMGIDPNNLEAPARP